MKADVSNCGKDSFIDVSLPQCKEATGLPSAAGQSVGIQDLDPASGDRHQTVGLRGL